MEMGQDQEEVKAWVVVQAVEAEWAEIVLVQGREEIAFAQAVETKSSIRQEFVGTPRSSSTGASARPEQAGQQPCSERRSTSGLRPLYASGGAIRSASLMPRAPPPRPPPAAAGWG